MVKFVYCLRRLPHLSRAEFQRYWLNTHGPLVRDRVGPLKIRRYVQVHTLESGINDALRQARSTEEPYDGVAELWWDSLDDLVAGASTPEGRKAAQDLFDDERLFIDQARSSVWIGEEHAVFES